MNKRNVLEKLSTITLVKCYPRMQRSRSWINVSFVLNYNQANIESLVGSFLYIRRISLVYYGVLIKKKSPLSLFTI